MRHGRKKRAANYADWWPENSFLLPVFRANKGVRTGAGMENPYRATLEGSTMTAVSTAPKTGQRSMTFRPKYITFDCYGTLTNFRMGDVAREIYADRVSAERMDAFLRTFT